MGYYVWGATGGYEVGDWIIGWLVYGYDGEDYGGTILGCRMDI